MDLERCVSADEILIPSSSSTKTYIVSFKEIVPTCNCIAYAIGRNRGKSVRSDIKTTGPQTAYCKHISEAIDNGVCRWRGHPLIPHLCPGCGSRTEPCETMSLYS